MSILERLPAELRIRVLDFCGDGDLAQLCLASRHVHDICVESLYRIIDLSSPYEGVIEKQDDVPTRMDLSGEDVLFHRQLALIRCLNRNPKLGAYVRTLRWTTVDTLPEVMEQECERTWAMQKDKIKRHKSNSTIDRHQYQRTMRELNFNQGNDVLWRTFSLFEHVQTIELTFRRNSFRREATAPPPLFPSATSISLSGMASRFLIGSILESGDPTRLRRLHLNLNEFAELKNVSQALPRFMKGRYRPRQPQVGIPRPMRTHLTRFTGRWTNLQSLEIDTVGQAVHQAGWDSEAEDARYQELAALLRSVAGSLQYFRFQQGLSQTRHLDGWAMPPAGVYGPRQPPPPGQRPMDIRFVRYLLPAIVGEKWPRLRRMELRGVASFSKSIDDSPKPNIINYPLEDATQRAIRSAVGEHVDLVVHPDATSFFWKPYLLCETGIADLDTDDSDENL